MEAELAWRFGSSLRRKENSGIQTAKELPSKYPLSIGSFGRGSLIPLTLPWLQFDRTDQMSFNLRFSAELQLLHSGHPLDSSQSVMPAIRTSNIRDSLQFSEIFKTFWSQICIARRIFLDP
jgi:hypothetical protein